MDPATVAPATPRATPWGPNAAAGPISPGRGGVGGLHPRWSFDRYVDMISAMRQAFPSVHLKAFTAVELDWMARKARKPISEIITILRNAGLNSFPGGGAEIFHPEIRDAICDTKVSGEQWIDTHRTAHRMGMRSNCTMLYGHIENYEHRVDHMRRLRELQDETNGFNVFIPLAFQPFQNEMGVNRYTFGADDLRTIAVARLYLDNFNHIKSYWVMLGQDVAQLALNFGANDLDGTVLEEKISRAAGGRSGMIMTRTNLEGLIRRSGRIPVERSTLYQPIYESDLQYLHPIATDDDELASELLQRLEVGSVLTAQETWELATNASLMQLTTALGQRTEQSRPTPLLLREVVDLDAPDILSAADAVTRIRRSIDKVISDSIADSSHGIDLRVDVTKVDANQILYLLENLKSAAPQCTITFVGILNIADAAARHNMLPTEWFSYLREQGVCRIEDSQFDQTQDPNLNRHQAAKYAMAADLRVGLILSLNAREAAVDWSDFSEQLVQLRSLFNSSRHIAEVHIQKHSQSAVIMPSEFMRAMALTRLVLGRDIPVMTEPQHIPTLVPHQGLGADSSQHPVMKILSVLETFGADGLTAVPLGKLNVHRIFEDLKASGVEPLLVDYAQRKVPLRADKLEQLATLRHIPCLGA